MHTACEFPSEIDTITIGILIARSLEAALETSRSHQLVEHAKADLRYELQGDRNALGKPLHRCKPPRSHAEALTRYVRPRLQGEKVAELKDINLSVNLRLTNTAARNSTVATQTLTNMPHAQVQALSRAASGSRGHPSLVALYELPVTSHPHRSTA